MAQKPLTIGASPETVKWGFFDARTPPIAEIASGEEVVLETLSGELTDIPELPGFDVLPEHRSTLLAAERGAGPHIVTGPVAVSGKKAEGALGDLREDTRQAGGQHGAEHQEASGKDAA